MEKVYLKKTQTQNNQNNSKIKDKCNFLLPVHV